MTLITLQEVRLNVTESMRNNTNHQQHERKTEAMKKKKALTKQTHTNSSKILFEVCTDPHTRYVCYVCVRARARWHNEIQVASAAVSDQPTPPPKKNGIPKTTAAAAAKQMKNNNEMKIVLDFSALNSTMKQFV